MNDTNKQNIDTSKIRLAPIDKIDSYPEECERILTLLGHPDALVTDWSSLGDFILNYDFEKNCNDLVADQNELDELSAQLGFTVKLRTTLVEICERLHEKA